MLFLLKIEKEYFQAIIDGKKNFEIRKNDRNYQAGDTVQLGEVEPIGDDEFQYSGRFIYARIGYVTDYEQKPGYVVFSLLDAREV